LGTEVRQRDPYARIRQQWIAEYPSPTPNVQLCSIAAPTLRHDASRRNGWPLRAAVLAGYVVTFEQ